jgi:transposase InsO family protein
MQRSSYYYRQHRDPQVELRVRLKDLAGARVRYGYRRLHVLLMREGWSVNHKRVYRLYKLEGLSLRLKNKKKRTSEPLGSATRLNRSERVLEHGLRGRPARRRARLSDADVSR